MTVEHRIGPDATDSGMGRRARGRRRPECRHRRRRRCVTGSVVNTGSSLLDGLPAPSDRRLAVRVTPDALRRIRARHPWVYDRSIESVNHDDGAPGDLGIVFDRNRKFAAIGLWDPNSPIRLRMIHVGDPVTVDAAWFAERIAESVARRQVLFDRHVGSGRAVHGRAIGPSTARTTACRRSWSTATTTSA